MSRRRVLVSLGAAAVAAVVATAALVTINDGEPKPASRALEHLGMVSGTVWVANEDGASLTAIDAGQNKVATTLTGIKGPHNVQVSPNGRTMWAVSGSDSLAAMVDTKTLGLHGTVPTGGMPAHLVLSPDGRTAYTTNGADNSVSAIDTKTMKPVAAIPVGSGPHGLRPSQDGKWVYVANIHVQNLDDFAALNKAYAVFFDSPAPPARATVQVARLPRGALVEISAIAVR